MTTAPSRPPAGLLRCELSPPPPGRSDTIRELRGLAIALVVLQYASRMLGWPGDLHFEVGISLLFILTGLDLVSEARGEGSLGSRAVRLLPAYWIVLTIYWLCNTHFLQLHYSALNVTVHYLALQGWMGDACALAIDEPLCLVALILTFTLCWRAGRRLFGPTDRLLLAAGLVSVPLACVFHYRGQAASFTYLDQPLPGLFAGLLLGRLVQGERLEFKLGPTLALAALLLTYIPFTQGVLFNPTLAGLSLMVLYAFAWKRLAAPPLEKAVARLLRFMSDYWLEILLIHQPLIREYNYYLEGRWFGIGVPTESTLIIGIAIGLAVTVVVSVALRRLLRKLPSLLPSSAP